jgi:hypothetical protein
MYSLPGQAMLTCVSMKWAVQCEATRAQVDSKMWLELEGQLQPALLQTCSHSALQSMLSRVGA